MQNSELDWQDAFRFVRSIALRVAIVALSGCGGGGGSSGGGGNTTGPQGSLTLSTAALSFTTNSPALTPPTQNVGATISTTATGTIFLRIVADGPAVAAITNIVVTGSTTGQGTVVPAAATALGPGRHTSTVTVTACTTDVNCTSGVIGTPQTVAVTYTINGVTSPTQSLSYRLPLTAVAADYRRQLSINAFPSYTVMSNQPWLSVTPATGASGTITLDANLAAVTVDALASGDHNGELTISAAGNTLRIPVTLTVAKPQLDQVTPYVALPNISDTVVMRGLFLDQLSASSFDFLPSGGSSGIAPTSVTIVSPTELRVVHPALVVGAYPVRMRDAQGAAINRSTARLFVAEAPTYAARTLAYPGANSRRIHGLVYDAERKALLLSTSIISNNVIDPQSNELLRYVHTNDWGPATARALPHADLLQLTSDGRSVLASVAASGSGTSGRLEQLLPDSLVSGVSVSTLFSSNTFTSLAHSSSGETLAIEGSYLQTGLGPFRGHRYRPSTNALSTFSFAEMGDLSESARVISSGDGLRALFFGNSPSFNSIYEFNSSTNGLTRSTNAYGARFLSMDRTGNRLAISNFGGDLVRIFDRNWVVPGTMPNSAIAFLVSPDGRRGYTFATDRRVHAYDLTVNVNGGPFPEIGTGITPAGDPGISAEFVRMALTPDARTLFLAGSAQIVVVPLPLP